MANLERMRHSVTQAAAPDFGLDTQPAQGPDLRKIHKTLARFRFPEQSGIEVSPQAKLPCRW
jgi:hypothetical protein